MELNILPLKFEFVVVISSCELFVCHENQRNALKLSVVQISCTHKWLQIYNYISLACAKKSGFYLGLLPSFTYFGKCNPV